MSTSAIDTAIITIASVIAAAIFASAVLPVLFMASDSIVSTAEIQGDKIQTAINIIARSNDTTFHYIWIKNTGLTQIPNVRSACIFFGPVGNFSRFTYNSTLVGIGTWNYTIANDCGNRRWDPHETIRVMVRPDAISRGDFYFQMVAIHAIRSSIVFTI